MASIGIASTNRVQHNKVREATFGVIPTSPLFQDMRVTSSSLTAGPMSVVSDEIRSDRQIADLILVGQKAGGDVGGELSFNAFDPDLEEVLQGAWTNAPNIVNNASASPISALSTTTLTVASGGTAFAAGAICVLENFPTPSNNGVPFVVSSSTGTTIVAPAATFAAETAAIPINAMIRQVGFQAASGDIVATTSGLTSTALNFTTLNLAAGTWINLGGTATASQFANAANNSWCRISAISANALTFDRLPTGWAADAGAGKTIKIWVGDYLRNGTTQRSNTIERQYLDQSPVTYEYLTGMCLDKLSMTVSAQKIVTLTESYVGNVGSTQTTRVASATDIPVPTFGVMNASSDFANLLIGGAALEAENFITELGLEIDNNLRQLVAVGSIGAVGVGNGEFSVKGKMTMYFADTTYYSYLLNNILLSLNFVLQAASVPGSAYLFDLPAVKLASGSPSVPGKNQNVMIPLEYQAIRSAQYSYTLNIQRFFYFE